MHNIPIFALGAFFTVVGVGLFLVAFLGPKKKSAEVPVKKAELRAQAERKIESGKFRLAGLLFTIFGVALMLLS